MAVCPFCKCDPYHWVDNGVCMERVAVTCCEMMIDFYHGAKLPRQALEFMQSPSPRKQKRANAIFEHYGQDRAR